MNAAVKAKDITDAESDKWRSLRDTIR